MRAPLCKIVELLLDEMSSANTRPFQSKRGTVAALAQANESVTAAVQRTTNESSNKVRR